MWSSVGLIKQYNVNHRMGSLPRTLGIIIYVASASQGEKKNLPFTILHNALEFYARKFLGSVFLNGLSLLFWIGGSGGMEMGLFFPDIRGLKVTHGHPRKF